MIGPHGTVAPAIALLLSACGGNQSIAPIGPALTMSDPELTYEVPYVATPAPVVAAMLDLVALRSDELLIDLGSGDGRIALAAGRRGARARGIEIDPALAARASAQARTEGIDGRVRFVREDLFGTVIRDADVVTLYLLPAVNRRLEPKLLTELRPGTRIVSHAFPIGDWVPDAHQVVDGRDIYLWTVPAVVGGRWQIRRPDGRVAVLDIDQRRQQLSGTLNGRPLTEPSIKGARLRFAVEGERFDGQVTDTAIAGAGWEARRVE